MRELASIFLMLFAVALLIKWGVWMLPILNDALDPGVGRLGFADRAATPTGPSLLRVSGKAGITDAKNPSAEIERGDGLVGGRGALNAQQLGDACNNSRPLGTGL